MPPLKSSIEDLSLKYMEEWRALQEESTLDKGIEGFPLADDLGRKVPKSTEWEKLISSPGMIFVDSLLSSMNGNNLRDTYFGESRGFSILDGCSSHSVNPDCRVFVLMCFGTVYRTLSLLFTLPFSILLPYNDISFTILFQNTFLVQR
jgi:hypothetical protein